MIVEKVELVNFRNHKSTSLSLSPGVNVLVGKNAQGKTNLLEAIFLTCIGRGWRTNRDREMINFQAATARVKTVVRRKFGQVAVEISLSKDAKKMIKINGIPVQRMGELMGQVNCVFFSPDELRLVKDAPADRRRFLDIDISQLDKTYFYALLKYNKILLQRNALLKERDEDIKAGLDIWDLQLAKAGAVIVGKRIEFISKLRDNVAKVHNFLASGQEAIEVCYEGITMPYNKMQPELMQHSAKDVTRVTISDSGVLAFPELEVYLQQQLMAARDKDMRLRTTTVGPHRDDLRITIDGNDVRSFASQGQQRTVALSIKLAELEIFKQYTGEMPILLLDDVFSELDATRQARLVEVLSKCQSIITAVDFTTGTKNTAVFKIENGTIN